MYLSYIAQIKGTFSFHACLPMGGGLLEEAEAPGLAGRVGGKAGQVGGGAVLGHAPPAPPRLPRQGDLPLLLAADLVPEVGTAANKYLDILHCVKDL